MAQYREEKLNNEGLSEQACLEVIIDNVEIRDMKIVSKMDKVEVQVKLGSFNESYKPESQDGQLLNFNRKIIV